MATQYNAIGQAHIYDIRRIATKLELELISNEPNWQPDMMTISHLFTSLAAAQENWEREVNATFSHTGTTFPD